jgi:acyl-coenzyme A synthetase/AMP-(fatty) acid ligase
MPTADQQPAQQPVQTSAKEKRTPGARTIYDQLARVPADRVAVLHGEAALSYGELRARVDAFAGFLAAHGVVAGDRVATRLRKGFEEIVCTFAAARIGAVFVNIHPVWPKNQANYVLDSAQPAVLVTDSGRATGLATGALIVNVDDDAGAQGHVSFTDALASADAPPPVCTDSTALAALLYTSGSTGRPKGVMHSQENLVRFGEHVAEYLGNTAEDRLLGLLPISFSYGLSQLLTAVHVGAMLKLPRSTIPTDIVATLERRQITGMAGVAMILDQVAAVLEESPRTLPHLRYITNAGGGMPDSLGHRLRRVLPHTDLVLMYGSTEALRSTYLPPAQYARKPGAIGQPIPGVHVDVITAAGKRAQPNEIGELVHYGDLKMLGYWRDEKGTAGKLRACPALADTIGDEPVLYTGDLAYRDHDGCLWFAGRADWMIKSGGFRYSITELEQAVESLEAVATAVAFPVEDRQRGQSARLAVVLAEGASANEKALLRMLKRELPSYMWPKSLHIIHGGLPVTVTGKLDRPALFRSLAADAPPGKDSERTQQEVSGTCR